MFDENDSSIPTLTEILVAGDPSKAWHLKRKSVLERPASAPVETVPRGSTPMRPAPAEPVEPVEADAADAADAANAPAATPGAGHADVGPSQETAAPLRPGVSHEASLPMEPEVSPAASPPVPSVVPPAPASHASVPATSREASEAPPEAPFAVLPEASLTPPQTSPQASPEAPPEEPFAVLPEASLTAPPQTAGETTLKALAPSLSEAAHEALPAAAPQEARPEVLPEAVPQAGDEAHSQGLSPAASDAVPALTPASPAMAAVPPGPPAPEAPPIDPEAIAERMRGRLARYLTGDGRALIEERCRSALADHSSWLVGQVTREVVLSLETELAVWVRDALREEAEHRSPPA